MTQARRQQPPPLPVHRTRHQLAVVGEQRQQCREIGAVPVTVDPRFGKTDIATGQRAIKYRPVINLQDGADFSCLSTRLPALTKAQIGTARQTHFQLAVADFFEQAEYGPCATRHGNR